MIQKFITTTTVKWKAIDGFPGYYVSNNGLVKIGTSLLRQRQYNRDCCPYFYVIVNNHATNQSHKKDIHRLVWDYFGNTPRTKGYEVHHKDLDYHNNDINNLCLISVAEHKAIHKSNRKAA